MYYQHLLFLQSVADTNATVSNIDRMSVDDSPAVTTPSQESSHKNYRPPFKKSKAQNDIGIEMINVLKKSLEMREERERDADGDKLFFLSLVDEFKKIPEHLKTTTKVDIIKTIQNAQSFSRPAFYLNDDQYPTRQWSGSLSSSRLDHASGYQRGYSTPIEYGRTCDAGTSANGVFQYSNTCLLYTSRCV